MGIKLKDGSREFVRTRILTRIVETEFREKVRTFDWEGLIKIIYFSCKHSWTINKNELYYYKKILSFVLYNN